MVSATMVTKVSLGGGFVVIVVERDMLTYPVSIPLVLDESGAEGTCRVHGSTSQGQLQ